MKTSPLYCSTARVHTATPTRSIPEASKIRMPAQVVVSLIVSVLEGFTVGLFTWIRFIIIGLPFDSLSLGCHYHLTVDFTAVCARTFSPEHLIQALFLLSLLITVYH